MKYFKPNQVVPMPNDTIPVSATRCPYTFPSFSATGPSLTTYTPVSSFASGSALFKMCQIHMLIATLSVIPNSRVTALSSGWSLDLDFGLLLLLLILCHFHN